ncbi:MAG: ImmA/IrrE family metallo-endopeptidase [Peptoniphilaceae bacterium]
MNNLQWQAEYKAIELYKKIYKDDINFPVDLDRILDYLNIELKYDNLIDEPGYIIYYKNKNCIVLNNNLDITPYFTKFTIAHEIGHIYLEHLDNNCEYTYKEKEYMANHFAGALLMPFSFMVAYRNEDMRLQQIFLEVSKQALDIRIKILKLDKYFIKACNESWYSADLHKHYKYSYL